MNRMFKAIISSALVGALAFSSVIGATAVKYKGDLDGDGKITSSDALKVLRYVVGLDEDEPDLTIADLDGDEKITSSDALAILKTCVGQIDPVELKEDEPTEPSLTTKQEIVDYYNNAIKKSVEQNVTINRQEAVTVVCDEISPDSSVLKKIVDKIIDSYAKTTTEKHTFTNGKASDTDKTASEFICPSNLEVAGVKRATVEKSGENYIVNIDVVAEESTLSTEPKYNKQCAAPLDLESVDLFGIKVTQADFTYPGSTLKATINPKGLLVNMEVTQPLSGTGGGKALGISFSGTFHGTYNQKNTFSYNAEPTEPTEPAEPTEPSLTTKQEIVDYYNNAVNKVISSEAGYTKSRTTQLDSLVGAEAIMKIRVAADAVNSFLGVGDTVYKNKSGEAKYLSQASLTSENVTSAICVCNDDVYTLTLNLADGNSSAPNGSSDSPLKKCGILVDSDNVVDDDYKDAQSIYSTIETADGASVKSVRDITKNAEIVATIDKNTGDLKSLTVSFDWEIYVTDIKYIIKLSGEKVGYANTTISVTDFKF